MQQYEASPIRHRHHPVVLQPSTARCQRNLRLQRTPPLLLVLSSDGCTKIESIAYEYIKYSASGGK